MVKLLIAYCSDNNIYVHGYVYHKLGCISELRVCLTGISDPLPPMSATI